MEYQERLEIWQQKLGAAMKQIKLSAYLQVEATTLLKSLQNSDDHAKYAIALDKASSTIERALKMEREAIGLCGELRRHKPEPPENYQAI